MLKIPDLTLREDCQEAASDPFLLQLRTLALSGAESGGGAGRSEAVLEARRENAAGNLVKEAVFDRVVQHLQARGVEVVAPYKGIYLLLTLYQDCPWLRSMADVDFIVLRKDFARVKEALREIGSVYVYDPKRPLLSRVYAEFPAQVSGVTLDVHRGFTPLRIYGLDTDRLLLEAPLVEGSGAGSLRMMTLAQATALQVFHDLSDGLAGGGTLTWERLAQVYVMIHNAGLEQVREACRGFGIERFLGVYVTLLERVFVELGFSSEGLEVPAFVPAFVAGIQRGDDTPFVYTSGELLFKARLFKGARLRKFLPRLLAPVDRVWGLFGRGET